MQRGTVQAIAASHLETPNMPSKIAQKASPLDTPSDSCVSRACASVTPIYLFFHLLDRPGGTGARRAARRQGAASKGGGGPPASDPPGAPAADRATDKRPGPGRAG
jgi:hypothetical protein